MVSLVKQTTMTDVYGPNVAICARPAFEETFVSARYRDTQDMLSGPPVALAGDTPVICSAGSADKVLLQALRDGGMPVATDLRTYTSEAEFRQRFAETLTDGYRIAAEYPQPQSILPTASAVNPAELVSFLNNKGNLDHLVSWPYRAKRHSVARDQLDSYMKQETAWVLKAATDKANGGGFDVYLHEAGEPVERPDFIDGSAAFVLEEYVELVANWSVQQYIDPTGQPRFFGQTEQRISAEGKFLGNKFGDILPPAPEFVDECRSIADRAAASGYRGFSALDGGLTADGRIIIFDLNFRISSASCPLLFLRDARPDVLDKAAETARWTSTEPIADVVNKLRKPVESGELVIMSGHDSRYTDAERLRTILLVVVTGDDLEHVAARRAELERLLT